MWRKCPRAASNLRHWLKLAEASSELGKVQANGVGVGGLSIFVHVFWHTANPHIQLMENRHEVWQLLNISALRGKTLFLVFL